MTRAASLLDSIGRTRARLVAEPELNARLARLQSWQLARLRRTYEDFHAQPRYRDGLEFFMNDLYGPHDYAQRDRELGHVLQMFAKLLPPRAMNAVTTALELETLSQTLDMALLDCLAPGDITETRYAQAYRAAGRQSDRQRQITLIVSAGGTLDDIVKNPVTGVALRAARRPARYLGVAALQDFLERGHQAFFGMHGAKPLLSAIEQRETAIMRKLFKGADRPFDWERT